MCVRIESKVGGQAPLSMTCPARLMLLRCSYGVQGWAGIATKDECSRLEGCLLSCYLGSCHWAQHPDRSSLPGRSAAEQHRQRGKPRQDPEGSATVEELVPCDDPAFVNEITMLHMDMALTSSHARVACIAQEGSSLLRPCQRTLLHRQGCRCCVPAG